ncbi:hypothetical protein [Arthrospiribacter ruber]|uniref:Glycosidase-related protein n=1 Tax=Arthrospiribacter ruber TaxID=2487934 RepID=A0A951J151_9BACT|nr:hypothetical protein [Arthrospiribacter ruber]MBW3469546.1 hypothetical protein [Arthrospiribacter ruber]
MQQFHRVKENPIIRPDKNIEWKAAAAFNPSVVKKEGTYHLLFRAIGNPVAINSSLNIPISTIGYTCGDNGLHFGSERQIIKPEFSWEMFGCEDPRVTYCEGKYYIFYTALSDYPFSAKGIHIGLAITQDFKKFEKHEITRFNSKAMALFPEKINGKFAAILTVHTDIPPAKIALALFDKEEDLWSQTYWNDWYNNLNLHVIPLLRDANDHLEIGAQPVKTEKGWLLIYSYIQNYFSPEKNFRIETALLDIKNPMKVIGKSPEPLIVPLKKYELEGNVPNIVFPSGALLEDKKLLLYYGAADTTSCVAIGDSESIIEDLSYKKPFGFIQSKWIKQSFKRFDQNPIIAPRPEFSWEAKATFNPAVIYLDNRFHIIYRAMSLDDTSVFGYASSKDGLIIDERLPYPIYEPRANFEKKLRPGNSGCEDPRITKMGDILYIFYAAFDGYTPRVAFTSIKEEDFLNKRWNWTNPKVITPPNVADKNSCLLSEKINGEYVIFHRQNDCICINTEKNLEFSENKWMVHRKSLIEPRKTYWDNSKYGIAAPPIKTKHGWLMFFHRATIPSPTIYKVEAALLDLNNPFDVIAQTDATLLEPEMDYEIEGIVNNVVFPCGAVLLDQTVYLYYGGADKVIGVAKMELSDIMKRFGICD